MKSKVDEYGFAEWSHKDATKLKESRIKIVRIRESDDDGIIEDSDGKLETE